MKQRVCIFLSRSERPVTSSRVSLYFLPGLRINPIRLKGLPNSADYILVTSKNALAQAKKFPKGAQWIYIGAETASFAIQKRLPRGVTVTRSDAEGIVSFFKRRSRTGSIFYPRSSRGSRVLPQRLRALGFRVVVRDVYQTEIRSVRRDILRILARAQKTSAAVWIGLTSPSSLLSYRKSVPLRWRRQVRGVVSIGPTTSASLRRLGWAFWQAPKPPRIESMIGLVAKQPL